MYNTQIIYTYIHTHHTCRISILYSVFLCNLHSYCMQRCINDPQSEHLTGVSCLSFVNKTTQFQFQCGGLSILTPGTSILVPAHSNVPQLLANLITFFRFLPMPLSLGPPFSKSASRSKLSPDDN